MSGGSAYTFITLSFGFILFRGGGGGVLTADSLDLNIFLNQFRSLGIPSLPSVLRGGRQKKYFSCHTLRVHKNKCSRSLPFLLLPEGL